MFSSQLTNTLHWTRRSLFVIVVKNHTRYHGLWYFWHKSYVVLNGLKVLTINSNVYNFQEINFLFLFILCFLCLRKLFLIKSLTDCYIGKCTKSGHLNLLGPSNTICWQGSGSALAQVMACSLTTPIHYLNQCRLLINAVHWHTPENNIKVSAQATVL